MNNTFWSGLWVYLLNDKKIISLLEKLSKKSKDSDTDSFFGSILKGIGKLTKK